MLKHDLRQRGERLCPTIVHAQARVYRVSFHRKISPIVSLLKSCVLVQDAVPEKDFGQVWRDRLRLVQLESNGWEVYSCDLSHDESLGVMGRHLQSFRPPSISGGLHTMVSTWLGDTPGP